MVATGGSEPSDCAVLRLPDFQPVQTLVGHQDWLFGAAWVSDRHLVTGSRDQVGAPKISLSSCFLTRHQHHFF